MEVNGTRSRQRPRDDRPRVERHQGAGHAGSARRAHVPDRDPHLGDRLVVLRPVLAAGNDLHEGPSWRRPEADGRGAARRGAARSVRLDEPHRDRRLRRDPRRRGSHADRAQHRASAVRRQLRGLPRKGRQGPGELPRPHRRRLAVGRRSRAHRADDARRHQHPASGKPDRPDARLRTRRDARPRSGPERGGLRLFADPSRLLDAGERRTDRGRAGGVPHDLRRLPRRGRQGKPRRGRSEPHGCHTGSMAETWTPSSPPCMADGRAICRPGTRG